MKVTTNELDNACRAFVISGGEITLKNASYTAKAVKGAQTSLNLREVPLDKAKDGGRYVSPVGFTGIRTVDRQRYGFTEDTFYSKGGKSKTAFANMDGRIRITDMYLRLQALSPQKTQRYNIVVDALEEFDRRCEEGIVKLRGYDLKSYQSEYYKKEVVPTNRELIKANFVNGHMPVDNNSLETLLSLTDLETKGGWEKRGRKLKKGAMSVGTVKVKTLYSTILSEVYDISETEQKVKRVSEKKRLELAIAEQEEKIRMLEAMLAKQTQEEEVKEEVEELSWDGRSFQTMGMLEYSLYREPNTPEECLRLAKVSSPDKLNEAQFNFYKALVWKDWEENKESSEIISEEVPF